MDKETPGTAPITAKTRVSPHHPPGHAWGKAGGKRQESHAPAGSLFDPRPDDPETGRERRTPRDPDEPRNRTVLSAALRGR